MTTATTKAARPRTTHPEQHGAEHNGAQDDGVAATEATFARIAEAEAARITETAAGRSQTTVAENFVANLMGELTMIVRSVVRLARELFGAAEFGTVAGLNEDADRQSDLCFGDPTAWV